MQHAGMNSLISILLITLLSCASLVSAVDVSIFTEEYFEPVVTDGFPIPGFTEGANDIHVEDEFHSRTKFDIDAMEFENFLPPTVEIVGTNGAVEDDVLFLELEGDSLFVDLYRQEEEEFAYELDVIYRCKKSGVRQVRVTIRYQVGADGADGGAQSYSEGNVTFAWRKVCVEGVARTNLHMVTEADELVVSDGVAQPEWLPGAATFVVNPSEHSTKFYIGVSEGSQTYAKPTFKITDNGEAPHEILELALRGEASTENIIDMGDFNEDDYYQASEYQMLEVIYKCFRYGVATVTVTYDIHPFNPVVFSWKKNCGAESGKVGFDISTHEGPGGLVDVLQGSDTLAAWSPESHTAFFSKAVASTSFYMRATSKDKFALSKPTLTVKPSGVFKPSLGGPLKEGGPLTLDPQELEVTYNCRKKGKAEVTVTIVIPHLKIVEFSWEKECGAKLNRPPDAEMWTANELLVLFCVSMAAIGGVIGFVYLRYKKKYTDRERLRLAQLRAQEEVETF